MSGGLKNWKFILGDTKFMTLIRTKLVKNPLQFFKTRI